ncbi:hypothetical protein [Brachybacterium sp. UNK5269]|uniref:hypothetical protein n=1 Tax=Brachybacterium sp. UNK5269 TaxID=3408576 RepID=UPI003BB0E619
MCQQHLSPGEPAAARQIETKVRPLARVLEALVPDAPTPAGDLAREDAIALEEVMSRLADALLDEYSGAPHEKPQWDHPDAQARYEPIYGAICVARVLREQELDENGMPDVDPAPTVDALRRYVQRGGTTQVLTLVADGLEQLATTRRLELDKSGPGSSDSAGSLLEMAAVVRSASSSGSRI